MNVSFPKEEKWGQFSSDGSLFVSDHYISMHSVREVDQQLTQASFSANVVF